MEGKAFNVSLEKNPAISIRVIPGHFTTSSAHISHYLDVTRLKSNARAAKFAAKELAATYISSTFIETIVCMENTDVIGAFLAAELLKDGAPVINSGGDINIITPMSNVSGKLIFHDSELELIRDKNIFLLLATVSSGRTLDSALECLGYYGGKIAGVSTLFLALNNELRRDVHALFTSDDIEGYTISDHTACPMCKAGVKLDAIISSEGYTKIPG